MSAGKKRVVIAGSGNAALCAGIAALEEGADAQTALNTMQDFNRAVDPANAFDPTILDGRCTTGLPVNKTNWANTLEVPPFSAESQGGPQQRLTSWRTNS